MSETIRPMSDEARNLAEIAGLYKELAAAESAHEAAKERAAALKKIAEEKAINLRQFIGQINTPMPLFEVWRQTPVTELGLPDGIVAILNEQGYDTVGQLADYTAAGKELTDIPHIGANKAEAIRQALERFWASRKAEGEV